MLGFLRRMQRAKVLEAPVPDAVRRVVARAVPVYDVLGPEEREKLERLVLVFLLEKRFEGAGGLELTDEMRVTIAARACLLVLHRVGLDARLYPDLDAIVVYPHAYRAAASTQVGPVVVESEQARLGESWTRGVVVLAWDAVLSTGHDVVVHEFAHQLDAEDGVMDGAPVLAGPRRYDAWARVLGAEFATLTQRTEEGRAGDFDAYGATNPAEFFAVVTEAFFERPSEIARKHPELYAELVAFYRIDPASRRAHGTEQSDV